MGYLNKNFVIIGVLALTIIVSGCINGGEEDVDEGITAIDVVDMDVSPNEIFAGGSIEASLTLENTGNSNSTLIVDDDEEDPQGTSILESYCPDLFRIESFRAESDRTESTQASYKLLPGEQISMNWNLRQFDEERIRFYEGDTCELSFSAPFEYSVESFQEFQVRDSDDLETANIESRSSRGPMLLAIDMVGSSSQFNEPYFMEEDFGREFQGVRAEVQMINEAPEDGEHGVVSADPPEIELIGGDLSEEIDLSDEIEVEGEETPRCDKPSTIHLYGGDSTLIGCDLTLEDDEADFLNTRTSISEVRARADYEYNAPLGTQSVEVEYRDE